MKKSIMLFFVASFISLSFVGCSDSSVTDPISSDNFDSLEKRPGNGQTIVEIAANDTNFTLLVAAVQFAELDEALNGNRQFTVFAPVNSAFLDLAASLNIPIEDLLTEPYRDLVTSVLLYHVSPGRKSSNKVINSGRVNTLIKQFAIARIQNGSAQIGNNTTGYANITAVDIPATNGVIHVLDKVILPVLP